ncbi:MAG: ATP-grasp domain-containing protein [Candidatus Hydrogenedentes bacterium]|nr:ATP-grasp domain-containing protein [Candidatus Hydrogenedentota bacterium]
MANTPLNILVLAVGGNVSQGILKALALSTLPHRVVGVDVSAAQFGLYTVDCAYVGPWASDPAFLDWLLALCRKERIDAILTGAEQVVQVLAANKALIESQTGAYCCVSSQSVIETGDDKLLTCEWLREQEFLFPAFAASEDTVALQRLRDIHGFPLIAKPRIGGGARGLFMIEDDADLEYASRKKRYVVQAVVGSDDTEYTAGCVTDRDGHVQGSIAMRRVLLSGTTYRAYLGDFPEVRAVAAAITKALGAEGPCNIQLRMTDAGPICFEINPRFSGTAPLRAHYGFNEVEAVLRHYVLGEAMTPMPVVTEGIALRYWNELYVNPTAHSRLESEAMLAAPKDFPSRIEPYGMT